MVKNDIAINYLLICGTLFEDHDIKVDRAELLSRLSI